MGGYLDPLDVFPSVVNFPQVRDVKSLHALTSTFSFCITGTAGSSNFLHIFYTVYSRTVYSITTNRLAGLAVGRFAGGLQAVYGRFAGVLRAVCG